jgi:hypothetical protein
MGANCCGNRNKELEDGFTQITPQEYMEVNNSMQSVRPRFKDFKSVESI